MADLPIPESRSDILLHNIADGTPDIDNMEPQSREEIYLKYIAQNGSTSPIAEVIPISNGGTGSTTAADALTALGAQATTDNSLLTSNKTIVGAINELHTTIGSLNNSLEEVLNGGS